LTPLHCRAKYRPDLSVPTDSHGRAIHAIAAQRQISGIGLECDPNHIERIIANQIRRTT
jgi:hypothetical protein